MSTIAVAPGFGGARTTVRRPAGRVGARGTRATGSLRLTRRGRLVLLVAFVAVLFAAITVFGGHSAATGEKGVPVETRMVVVSEGDTLWGIAGQIAEPGQTREMVHQIQELNALSGAALVEGQRLAVPVD